MQEFAFRKIKGRRADVKLTNAYNWEYFACHQNNKEETRKTCEKYGYLFE